MNSLSHGCRRASSLGEGAFGMAGTLTVDRLPENFSVAPEAPSQRGLSAKQTGGVS